MQQKLFHSAHCSFLACTSVCGALLSVKTQSEASENGCDNGPTALYGILLSSLANASACATRLKVVWSTSTATCTSLFPHKFSVSNAANLSYSQDIGLSSHRRLFQAKNKIKSDEIGDLASDGGTIHEQQSESIQIQYSQLLTVTNLTSCLPDSPEYLCDLALSLIQSHAASVDGEVPSRYPTSSTVDVVVMQWRKIEILVLLKK